MQARREATARDGRLATGRDRPCSGRGAEETGACVGGLGGLLFEEEMAAIDRTASTASAQARHSVSGSPASASPDQGHLLRP